MWIIVGVHQILSSSVCERDLFERVIKNSKVCSVITELNPKLCFRTFSCCAFVYYEIINLYFY